MNTFSLIAGDDYQAADNRALLFSPTLLAWPDLEDATIALKIRGRVARVYTLLLTAAGEAISNTEAYAELTSSETDDLYGDSTHVARATVTLDWQLVATIGSHTVTLERGTLTVAPRIPDPVSAGDVFTDGSGNRFTDGNGNVFVSS